VVARQRAGGRKEGKGGVRRGEREKGSLGRGQNITIRVRRVKTVKQIVAKKKMK